MDEIPQIILHNPFRILGVYANSKRQEIAANKSKATAFLKVGKTIEYPLDLRGVLPPLARTFDSMNEAESHLAIAKEQIKYTLFWFIKLTPIDDVAFNHLLVGKIDDAISIWSKQDNMSSLQNKMICYLIKKSIPDAISIAQRLYSKFGDIYIEKTANSCTLKMSGIELRNLFIDSLADNVGIMKLLNAATGIDWKSYICRHSVEPLIARISSEVERTKRVDHKDPKARIDASKKLVIQTKEPFNQLKSLLPLSDPQFQMIADKLGLEILQCGIDYYNNSEDDDAAYNAMTMQKYAQSIVAGTLAKQRCDENVKILQKIIDELPPKEVLAEDRAIKVEMGKFARLPHTISSSILLLRSCATHIVKIKEKLGNTHHYYLKISTSIINNALNNIITEVNESQTADFNDIKFTLISAWRAQLYMDKFDLDPEYKEGRYKECRDALSGIISTCKGFDDPKLSFKYQYGCGWCNDLDVSDVDLRTEEEYYHSCCNLTSYKLYLKKYPSGKYAKEVKSKIEQLTFHLAKTIVALEKFICDFPKSELVPRAQEELQRLRKNKDDQITRIERQNRSIISCRTTDEVISLYNREKINKINIDKCSRRAFELARCEEDYRKVISIFGDRSAGGEKAKAKLNEIDKKQKENEDEVKPYQWFLLILIPLLVLFGIYQIWGISGLSIICYVFAFIFGLGAFVGIRSKEGVGCLIGIISGAIAFGFGSLGSYLEDLSKEDKQQKTEYVSSYTNGSTNNSSGSDYLSSSTTDDTNDESYTVDNDYETYINNQLKTGSKPYKDYYRSRTGDNYLDFKTSGNDYVIIVRDYSSSDVVNHIYIRAGDTGRLYLPNGTYNIYFYGGKGWNPDMENGNVKGGFVSGGHIQKDGPVELYNQYGEYTLYPVQNGNLQLQGASKGEAF